MKQPQLLSMLVQNVEMLLPCKKVYALPPTLHRHFTRITRCLSCLASRTSHQLLSMFAPNCIDYALVFHACALSGIVVSPVAPNFQVAELKQQLQVVHPFSHFIAACFF